MSTPFQKTIQNNQFARTSDANGNRTTPLNAADLGLDPLADFDGRLITRLALANGFVTSDNPLPVTPTESVSRLVIKTNTAIPNTGIVIFNEPVIIYSITGINLNGLDSYIQIFDLAALPVDTVTPPDYSYYLPSGPNSLPEELSIENIYPSAGFQNGLVMAYSSRYDVYEEQGSTMGFTYIISYSLPTP